MARRWSCILAVPVVALCPFSASAETLVLTLAPAQTSVTFTVKATGHDVSGVLVLDAGEIRFDPDTGAASGQVAIDLRRTETGNRLRDREMHGGVLETERYPLATFRPSRFTGSFPTSGAADLLLAGVIAMHGGEHSVSLPVRARIAGSTVSAETAFAIPYVAWGLRDPSLLFLRVAPVATINVRTEASLRIEGESR